MRKAPCSFWGICSFFSASVLLIFPKYHLKYTDRNGKLWAKINQIKLCGSSSCGHWINIITEFLFFNFNHVGNSYLLFNIDCSSHDLSRLPIYLTIIHECPEMFLFWLLKCCSTKVKRVTRDFIMQIKFYPHFDSADFATLSDYMQGYSS